MNLAELKEIIEDFSIDGDKIYIKKDLYKAIDVIKTHFSFDILKNITAIDNMENGIELIYSLYSTSDDEELLISISTNDCMESVSAIFDSAVADEK